MTRNDEPAWVQPGMQVAEFSYRGLGGEVALAIIERLTATQIVLDNGRRYRREDRRQIGVTHNMWVSPAELLSVDDVRVRNAIVRKRLRRFTTDFAALQKGMPADVDAALTWLDDVQRQVAAAKADILQLTNGEDVV